MSEKSWASLAPLLDNRRYVESVVTGLKIPARREFRFCATMNDDASTFELPEYILSRLQPQIFIDFPEPDEERLILQRNLPFAPQDILDYVVRFLQLAHQTHERYTVRDGINIARYALKVLESDRLLGGATPAGRPARALRLAIEMILGDQALRYFS
jgi:MoxR-like ATPase